MRPLRFARFRVLAPVGVVLAALLAGCGSPSTTSAQFLPSRTAPIPGLVKLVQKSRSGSRLVVDALIYGPEPNLDLLAFQFGIKIGDPSLVKFVTQPAYAQTALVAETGEAISMTVDGSSDPSLVQIQLLKVGVTGNGIAGASAVVIELAFDVQGSGGTTLTITDDGVGGPRALDSHLAPIAAVTFDPASAGVRGVTTGGGGY